MSSRISQLSNLELVEMLAFAHEYKGHAVAAAIAEFEKREVNEEEHDDLVARVYDLRIQRNRQAEPYHRLIHWLQTRFKRKA